MKKNSFKNLIAILISSFFFLNIYGLYLTIGTIIFLFLLYYLKDTFKFIDINIILLFFFGLTYCLFDKVYNEIFFRNVLSFLFLSSLIYLLGRHLGSMNRSEKNYLLIYSLITTCLLFVYSYSIVKEVFENGVSANRVYFIEFASRRQKNIEVSVTGICAHFGPALAFLSLPFIKNKPNLNFSFYFLLSILVILTLFVSIVTATRYPQVVGFLSILVTILRGVKSKNVLKSLFVLLSIFFLVYSFSLYVSQFDLFSGITSRYSESDLVTAGDRSVAWKLGFVNLFEYPFGGEPMNTVSYYHNFWLDIRKVSGIIPFLIMLTFTLINYKFLFYNQNLRAISNSLLEFSRIGFVTLLLIMFVEPIIEGAPLLFYFFIFYCGLNKSFYSVQKSYSKT